MKKFSLLNILFLWLCLSALNAQSGVDAPRLIEESYNKQIKQLEQKIQECDRAKQNAEIEKNRKIQEGYSQEKINEENKGIQMYAESIESYQKQIAMLKNQKQTALQQAEQLDRALKKATQEELIRKKKTEIRNQQAALDRRRKELTEKAQRKAEAYAKTKAGTKARAEQQARIEAAKQQKADEIEEHKKGELQNSYGNTMHDRFDNNAAAISQLDKTVSSDNHRKIFLQGDLNVVKSPVPSNKKNTDSVSMSNLLSKVKRPSVAPVDSVAIWMKELEQVNEELGVLNKEYDKLLQLKEEEEESEGNNY